jgi:hypothetical protein
MERRLHQAPLTAVEGSLGRKEPIAEKGGSCFEERTALGECVVLGDQDLSDELRGVDQVGGFGAEPEDNDVAAVTRGLQELQRTQREHDGVTE